MAQQPLFFEPHVAFEKSAAEVMLPEDPNAWPNELMQELYKQVPYVSDFEPHVTMDRVDAERGFGFGHVEVQNQTELQSGADQAGRDAAGVQSARIPIVIKDRKLQPLDLIITADSKVLPLTESRLRSTIFRPQTFDITGQGPGDMSMISQLYPPFRQNYGFGGGGTTMNAGMGKEGQKTASLLDVILPTINAGDYNTALQKIADDRGLQAQFAVNAGAADALRKLAQWKPRQKVAAAVMHNLRPSVVQLSKIEGGYFLKSASHAAWAVQEQTLDRGQAVKLLGPKVVLAADQSGAVTLTIGDEAKGEEEEPVQGEPAQPQQKPEEDEPQPITQFGIYKVQNDKGQEIIGYVFPNLIDVDGTSLPISLFTNGSEKAIQGDIVGINVGGGASLFEGPPRGQGCFYHHLSNGRAQATVPMNLQASVDAPGQGATVMHGETFNGTPVQVSIQPNIQECTYVDGQLLIPDFYSWLPLDAAVDTHLVEQVEAWGIANATKEALATVELRCGQEGTFSLRGFPVEKLAHEQREFLSLDDTMFLLGGLGAKHAHAQQKIGEAAAWSRPVNVRVSRYIKTAAMVAEETKAKAMSKVAAFKEVLPLLKKDLLKEAAVIPDPTAVDTVLSLGFLNPENLGAFIAYLPVLDEAQSKLCELLLASRLGLRNVPTGALEKAVRSLEESIEGLRVVAFQKQ